MRKYANRKPLLRFRFKDRMGYVFFRQFHTCREARLWFERNKDEYMLMEIGSMDLEANEN